jgi:inner membrane protein
VVVGAHRKPGLSQPDLTSAKLIEGESLEVMSLQEGDMRGKHLAWLLERIDRQRTYYLMGEMLVGKELKEVANINLYRPADFDGKVLHLHSEIHAY